MWAQLSEPPPVPSSLRAGLPVAIDAIVARALAKDPDERPAAAGALGHAAQAALSGDPTVVAPPPSHPVPRRRRAVAALAGVAGLAAAVAGGLALLSPDAPDERASTAPRSAGPSPPADRPSARRHAGSATGRAASRSRTVRSGCSASPRATSPGSIPRRSSSPAGSRGSARRRCPWPAAGATSGSRSAPRASAPAGHRERPRPGPDHAAADAGRRRAGR